MGPGQRAVRGATATLCAALVLAGALTGTGAAQDPAAPPGASVRWLPCERWVMQHWLPFDDRQMFRLAGISRWEARAWIQDDVHHTFGQLLRQRGLRPATAARRLVAGWTRGFDPEHRAVLRERARRILTNGHLAQHTLFHHFHFPDVGVRARRALGVAPARYLVLRRAGWSPAEIGALGRRSRAASRAGIRRVWRAAARRGIRGHATPPRQGRRFARLQVRKLERYLDSRIERLRPGPPPRAGQRLPRPRLQRLCTIFAGSSRAADPVNYGPDGLSGRVVRPAVCRLR